MGYNNNYRSDRYYDDRRGGYDRYDRRDYDRPSRLSIPVGTLCHISYNKDVTVCVIRHGREQYECRNINTLATQWLYESELVPITNEEQK